MTLPFYCPTWSQSSFGWGTFRDCGGYRTKVDCQGDAFDIIKLLSRICTILNKLVKTYIAHTRRYELRQLSPYDFTEYEAWHLLDRIQFNHVKVRGLHNLVCESKEQSFNEDVMKSIRGILESKSGLDATSEMLINARVNLELGERRAAITSAVTAIEKAIGDFVTGRLHVGKLDDKRAGQLKECLGVWNMLNTLFPLLLKEHEVERLKTWGGLDQVVKRMNNIIKSRNDLIQTH